MKFEDLEDLEAARERASDRWDREWAFMRKHKRPRNLQEYRDAYAEYVATTETVVAAWTHEVESLLKK